MPATLTPQMLIDAVHAPRPVPFPFTSSLDQTTPRYSYPEAGPQSWRLPPGAVSTSKVVQGLTVRAAGFGPWLELSHETRTNPGKADVAILSGHLYSLSKSTGTWTERVAWGGTLGWAGQLWVWDGPAGGTASTVPGPGGSLARGWSSTGGGHRFGDMVTDTQAPNGQGFDRIHGWPMSWPFTWLGVDPTSDQTKADPAKVADLAGLLGVLECQVIGDPAAVAASRFVISTGVDTYYEGAPTVGLAVGSREGSGGGTYRLSGTPSLAIFSTLSDAQIAAHPPTIYPGWQGTVTPPPPVDTKHKVRSLLEVDGVIVNPNEPVTLV